MSYILDALKRADAERERGAVPGLHAQQNAALAAAPSVRPRIRLWLITATVLALSAIAAGLWLWRGPATDSSLATAQVAAVAPSVSTAPAAPVTASTPAPVPVPATPPTPVVTPAPAPTPIAVAPPALAPAPLTTAQVAAPSARATASRTAAPAKPVAAPEPPAAAPAPIPLLGELPEDLRRQIPALTITGAVYSETPGQRLLLVNNQVLNQGAMAAPDVSLEEIRPKSSVFNFQGTRFRLTH